MTEIALLLWQRFAHCLLLVLLSVGFAVWGMHHLSGFAWSWDEGVLPMTSWMVARGYQLYTQVGYDYPPLYPLLLAGAFRLPGEGVIVGRGVALASGLGGSLVLPGQRSW